MKSYYLQRAEENMPALRERRVTVETEAQSLTQGETLVLDLGEHCVGYFSFCMGYAENYIDAPVRLELRFCETEREIDESWDDYRGGLCRSWLQDEVINIDFPGEYRMPRRYAARYIRVKVLCASQPAVLSDFAFSEVTSADDGALLPASIPDSELAAIDRIAVRTLRGCMQRVFEDGPKRDRRLWIGDLRLEALANYDTFRNLPLVRRCLYLFAAAEPNEYGILPGFVYENPAFVSGSWFLIDYALMFVCTLCDLVAETGEREIFSDLYPVAKRIMDTLDETRDESGLATDRSGTVGSAVFVDWCKGLRKLSALHGIYLYTLLRWSAALSRFGKAEEAELCLRRLEDGREAARRSLYNAERGAFLSERDGNQYSVHTAVWMVLGGVVCGEEAERILLDAISSEDSVKPFTPYMHHYTVEALLLAGAHEEAEKYLRRIWGGMARSGANTFPEVYVPGDSEFSPYRDRRVNSMCHAWSCTATHFIRKYGMGKAK